MPITSIIILDKEKLDFEKYYDNNLYKVYRNFSITLIKLLVGKEPKEIGTVLADDYFAPDGINLEKTIKSKNLIMMSTAMNSKSTLPRKKMNFKAATLSLAAATTNMT